MRRVWCRSLLSQAAASGLIIAVAASPALAQPAASPAKPSAPAKPAAAAPAAAPAKPAAAAPAAAPAKPAAAAPAAAPAKPAAAAPAAAENKTAGAAPPKAKKRYRTDKERKDAAKKFFEEGNAKLSAGDFVAAAAAFGEADEVVPGPAPKYKRAEALDKGGDIEGAISAYGAFLASNPPPEKNQARIDEAKARTAALEATPGEVLVAITPVEAANAALFLDDKPVKSPAKASPGKHVVRAKLDGFTEGSTTIEVVRGKKLEVALALTPAPKPAPAEVAAATVPTEPESTSPSDAPTSQPDAEEGRSRVPAIVTLSIAGAGAVIGGVFGGLALKSKGEFEDQPSQELFDQTERNALIADMSFGVALTFGVTGLVLLLSGEEGEQTAASTKMVSPWVGPNGAGAVGTFRF
jgi:hypothetical protein